MTRIEKTAAAAMAVSFLLLAAAATRSFVLSRRPDPATLPLMKIGDSVKLPGSSPGAARPTLVMVLSSQCPSCIHDVPFYKQLSGLRASSGGALRLVAVLPEKRAVAATFLGSSSVNTDEILSMAPRQLGVQLLPTLLLIDERGKLARYWVGELDQGRQQEVLSVLQASCAACRVPREQ